MNTLNVICWTDIPVTDLDRAAAFYSAVLNREVKKQSEEGYEIAMINSDEGHGNFCLCKLEGRHASENGPLIYLSAEGRLEDAVAKVESSGGKVLQGKHSIAPYGHRALIVDSEGNGIALHSMEG